MTPRTSISRLADCAPIPRPESWAGRKAPMVPKSVNRQIMGELQAPRVATARVYPLDQVAEVETMLEAPSLIWPVSWDGIMHPECTGIVPANQPPPYRVIRRDYIDDTPVMRAAHAAIEAEARATARAAIKMRAHLYALHPKELDAIEIGLSRFTPHQLASRLRQIARDPTLRRWYGFGGEVPAINLRGATVYARYLRAKAHQIARRAR